MAALEHGARRRPGAVVRCLQDGDRRAAGCPRVVLDEQVVATADLDRERVAEIAAGRVRQGSQRAVDTAIGGSLPHRDEPLLPPPRGAASRRGAVCGRPCRVGDRDGGRGRVGRIGEIVSG